MPVNLQERLQSWFLKIEIEKALLIGQSDEPLKEKIARLFSSFADPLLGVDEIQNLLSIGDPISDIQQEMDALVSDGFLEVSTQTQRALDPKSIQLYRKKDAELKRISVYALESIDIGSSKRSFQFSLDGRLIRSIAKVDRLDAIAGSGQQRDEIANHIKRISEGIQDGNQIPNSIILTIDDSNLVDDPEDDAPESFTYVRSLGHEVQSVFDPYRDEDSIQQSRFVRLEFPYRPAMFDEEKAVLLVDGQQRTAAFNLIDIEQKSSVPINLVLATSESSKKVFQIANSTQKISTEFSRILTASIDDPLPYLKKEKLIADACHVLAIEDASSPFYKIVKYQGTDLTNTVVAFNSLFRVVQTINAQFDLEDPKALADIVKSIYNTIKVTWPNDWGVSSKKSKLTHGVGLVAMAKFIAPFAFHAGSDLAKELPKVLSVLKNQLAWSNEEAVNGSKSQLDHYAQHIKPKQNTPQDIEKLQQFIHSTYVAQSKKK